MTSLKFLQISKCSLGWKKNLKKMRSQSKERLCRESCFNFLKVIFIVTYAKNVGARVRVPQNKSGKCSIPRVLLYTEYPQPRPQASIDIIASWNDCRTTDQGEHQHKWLTSPNLMRIIKSHFLTLTPYNGLWEH